MNILIQIKSLFRGEGLKAAQTELAATKSAAQQVQMPQTLANSASLSTKELDKLQKQVRGTNSALHATQALARGDVFGALNMASAALAEKLGNIGKKLAGIGAGFAIGWQIGTMIRDLTGLGKKLDSLLVQPPQVAKSIRDMANEKLGGLRAELESTSKRLESLARTADLAAARIGAVLQNRAAAADLAAAQEEANAPEAQRPVIAARRQAEAAATEVATADATLAERQKAAAQTSTELANLRRDLAAAKSEAETKRETALDPTNPAYKKAQDLRKELGLATSGVQVSAEFGKTRPAKQLREALEQEEYSVRIRLLTDARSAQEQVSALQASLDSRIEADTQAQQDVMAAETALIKAKTAQVTAQSALTEKQKAAATAATAPDPQSPISNAPNLQSPPSTDTRITSLNAQIAELAAAYKTVGPLPEEVAGEPVENREDLRKRGYELIQKRNALQKQAIRDQAEKQAAAAQPMLEQAADLRKAADVDAAQAEQARSFALDPSKRQEADRAARKAEQTKKQEDKQFASLLDRARKAGYSAVANKDGNFDIVQDKRGLGVHSKRLSDAMLAAAEKAKAEGERKQADQLEKAAKEAQVKAARLLETIAKNTEQGPVV
jgi:hypothetical protein